MYTPGYKPNDIDCLGVPFERYIKVYNNTGGALTNGDVVVVSFAQDTSGNFPLPTTPATSSITVKVGVVQNAVLGQSGIANAAWGFVQIQGYCPAITKTTTANPVAVDDFLKAMNGVKTAATDGTSGSTSFAATSFAIAKSVVATGVAGTVSGILLGRDVTI